MREKVKKIAFFLRKSVEKIVEIYYNKYIQIKRRTKRENFCGRNHREASKIWILKRNRTNLTGSNGLTA